MKKPIYQLPYLARFTLRLVLLPCAMLLHLIPHVIGWVIGCKNWLIYGGEFITYEKNETATIAEVYDYLKQTKP